MWVLWHNRFHFILDGLEFSHRGVLAVRLFEIRFLRCAIVE